MNAFITYTQLFASQDIHWWTGVMWITCGLLWCFYQLFALSFWRHPFTVKDPSVSKWCNAKFLQIYSKEETNSRVNFQQTFIFRWTIPLIISLTHRHAKGETDNLSWMRHTFSWNSSRNNRPKFARQRMIYDFHLSRTQYLNLHIVCVSLLPDCMWIALSHRYAQMLEHTRLLLSCSTWNLSHCRFSSLYGGLLIWVLDWELTSPELGLAQYTQLRSGAHVKSMPRND